MRRFDFLRCLPEEEIRAIVVPRMASTVSQYGGSVESLGTSRTFATSAHGTLNDEERRYEENNAIVSHFSTAT